VAGAGRAPGAFALEQNVPNPFNPRTEIGFELGESASVTLLVLDAAGRRVRTLIEGEVRARGRHAASWDGLDDGGRPLPSGVYFYRLAAGGAVEGRRMSLVR
jgi:hypothetical protein